ncbi:hypothetical protein [Clostridium gasigenes]|nr:hypothetical protein [Clostridium gasigenes]
MNGVKAMSEVIENFKVNLIEDCKIHKNKVSVKDSTYGIVK